MRDVADKSQPVASADRLGAERSETLVSDGASLEVSDIIRGVVHQLNVPDTPLVGLLEPLELSLKEVKPLHVTHYRGLPLLMCGL